jgi:hypothetical protein
MRSSLLALNTTRLFPVKHCFRSIRRVHLKRGHYCLSAQRKTFLPRNGTWTRWFPVRIHTFPTLQTAYARMRVRSSSTYYTAREPRKCVRNNGNARRTLAISVVLVDVAPLRSELMFLSSIILVLYTDFMSVLYKM